MKLILLIIQLLTIAISSYGQPLTNNSCLEIKYLDFFGLEKEEIAKWSASEMDQLMKMNLDKDNSTIKSYFLLPMIIYQLREYHPECNSTIDIAYFNQISELYLKIRGMDPYSFSDKSMVDKIDLMISDFYSQVENVELLPRMITTFDDGPFYGKRINKKN